MPLSLLCVLMSMSKIGRTAASVFPVAVGEMRRTFFPSRILGMTFCCGSEGDVKPFSSISLRIGRENVLKTLRSSI